MRNIILIEPTEFKNGIMIKKTVNNINSCELRKISITYRDNGYIASISGSTKGLAISGTSWRGNVVNSPVSLDLVQEMVYDNWSNINKIITDKL
tara:strand:- start:497 stop:778 length:282 start_codon:yes stop_codon:yes gene_type:complete